MITLPSSCNEGEVWFVYDDDCPICSRMAQAVRIREAAGQLHLVNAREDLNHPLMQEIREKGFDLDEGIVIKLQDACYHGADALHVIALLSTNNGWFNRINALLFRSRKLSKLCYPAMRAIRNLALRLKGIHRIQNLNN